MGPTKVPVFPCLSSVVPEIINKYLLHPPKPQFSLLTFIHITTYFNKSLQSQFHGLIITMLNTLLILLSTLLALATSYPYTPSTFYLVTTEQSTPTTNSSLLRAVSATSLFDPYYRPALAIRLTGPGYGSLPNFTLTDGTLHTIASGPHGIGVYEYNSTAVVAGQELQFLAAPQPAGGLALSGGYLLSVNGTTNGWTICVGELEQDVVSGLLDGLARSDVLIVGAA